MPYPPFRPTGPTGQPEKQSLLNEHQQALHEELLALIPGAPPAPWRVLRHIDGGGIFAGGWTAQGHVLLLSADGYSVTDVATGERLARDRDQRAGYDGLSATKLVFTLPSTGEQVPIFGVHGGCCILYAHDGWSLERLNPLWPEEMVLLWEPLYPRRFAPGTGYFVHAHALDFRKHMAGDLHGCSFSPSFEHIMFAGGDGALIYSRM